MYCFQMEEYVEIPTEMNTQDIEIRTCDEETPGLPDADGAQHFYIVQQTPEGLVIQVAEPNAGATDACPSASELSKQFSSPVVALGPDDTSELVTSTMMNASDITNLVASELVTSDVDTGDVVMSQMIRTDDVTLPATEVLTDDIVTPELVDSKACDIQVREQATGLCKTRADDTNVVDDESADHACVGVDAAAADHAYTSDGQNQQSVNVLVRLPAGNAVDAASDATVSCTSNTATIETTAPDSEAASNVAKDVQESVPDITLNVQELVSNDTSGAQEQVSDIKSYVQEQVPNDTIVQEQMSDDVESEVGSNPPDAVPQMAADPSYSTAKEGIAKAAPLRRMSTRARKCRTSNEPPNLIPDVAVECTNEELQPKMKAYQKWQRLPPNKDVEKTCVDEADEAGDMLAEKNKVSKRVGKKKPVAKCVANRRVCYARKENDAMTQKSETSFDMDKLNVADAAKVDSDMSKSCLLTETADIHTLKAEVDQLQNLNAELKNRMKQMEKKSLFHHGERKVLSGSTDRAMLSSAGDRKIGINWKDMKFSVRKSSAGVSPRNTSPKDSAENKAYLKKIDGLASQGRELLHREEMVEKKEQRLKALDMELDRRTSMIKCKEAKLERLESQLKARENSLMTREKRLLNRENREVSGEVVGEKVAGQPKETKLNEREKQLRAKEKELETKQELLRTTERQLTALGQELTDKFHYLKTKQGGRSVSVAMATSIVASRKDRRKRGAVGRPKLAGSAGSDSNNNRRTRTKPATAVRKGTQLGPSRKMTQLKVTQLAAKKAPRVTVTVAKRTDHMKAMSTMLTPTNKKTTKIQVRSISHTDVRSV